MKLINDMASLDTEKAAREFARTYWHNRDLLILHSPHSTNQHGDYFVELDKGQMIRSWENLLFQGLGARA